MGGSEEEERRRRGKEREIIVRLGDGECERGAVCPARCKTRGIRRAARLINRVLSSSNWQSSNNHLEAPPVNPELILGVTVRRHSYHSARIQSSARSLLFSSHPGEKASFAFLGRVFAFPLPNTSLSPTHIYPTPFFPFGTEIFNSLPSFAFDLNFFNRSLKTGTTFRSRPSFRYPSCCRPLRAIHSAKGDISVFALQMVPG